MGFNKGYGAAHYDTADAYYTTMVLRQLRQGNTAQATKLLETELDGHIVSLGVFEPMHRSRLNLVRYTDLGPQAERGRAVMMADVAKYRQEHPPQHPDEAVKQTIRSTLERFAAAVEHNQTDGSAAATPSEGDASENE
ncbi:MAG: hypothetical protein ACYS9X_20565 [Planctomycetota bacterium]|jgi:class 3 adenylate cyclase